MGGGQIHALANLHNEEYMYLMNRSFVVSLHFKSCMFLVLLRNSVPFIPFTRYV